MTNSIVVRDDALGARHYFLFFLCFLLVLVDGYDASTLAYTAPAMIAEFQFDPSQLGVLFSAHLVGMVIGSPLFGRFADKYGRKPTVVFSTFVFTLFTALTAFEHRYDVLLVYRLLTGIGLGGAVASGLAVASEYAPSRRRATIVSTIYSGFPLGSVCGGYLAAHLIESFGWRSVFLLGGLLGVPLLVALIASFPESVKFSVEAKGDLTTARRNAAKFGISLDQVSPTEDRTMRSPLAVLFQNDMRTRTALLWLTFFVTQLVLYFIFMWMPTVMKVWELPVKTGIIASATFSLGGVIGAVTLARLVDRSGSFRTLTGAYLIAILFASFIGLAASSGAVTVILIVAATGFFLNGSNVNLASVATALYPTEARSTGVGWAMALGRAGGIAGSFVGGVLLQSELSLVALYPIAATPLILAALAMWKMGHEQVTYDRARAPA